MTPFFMMAAVVIFLIGLSKGGLGGTLVILATPLMSLVMPVDQVIGLLLPILILGDIFAVASHWGRWNQKLVLFLIPGSLLGIGLATLFIASFSTDILRRSIGVILLLFVIYKLLIEPRIGQMQKYTPRNWHGSVAGGIGGFTSTLAHVGAPPILIYLLLQNISPRVFVATTALTFATFNLIKIPSYYYLGLFNFELLWQVVWLLPLLPLSVWLGVFIADKINKVLFDRIIIALLTLSAILLLVR